MWVSGVVALALFLTPAGYVVKYYAFDRGAELSRADRLELTVSSTAAPGLLSRKSAQVNDTQVSNTALLVRVLEQDPHSTWRLAAVKSLGAMLTRPYVNYTHPLECLSAKAELSHAAVADGDARVRATASDMLGVVAEHGAVIRR